MTLTTYGTKIDVRGVALRERHPLVFNTFHSLGKGESMELIHDDDPQPLRSQFQAEKAGLFAWDYLENGPQTWRGRVTKLATGHADGQCCGSCGGA